ncbi:arylsulfatase [Pochonia chlamydosporia 170]|uniref:Arylsulfatase n=1 Tax=Pochonia chlamydosporia 170 TaxID=1380566 RepID=A0A179F207_METCM|nr:arylsulfatase [Pochonia chlamydosporia 170]OAQ59462.2 arylsulfatase [Pochonia chlamydosporia 170]
MRPNIIFVFTDDQDLHLGSLDYMSSVKNELAAKGTTFSNHFATVSQCCPSRASLLRGQHAHNTNNTFVSAPGGNYAKWLASGENNDYLPMWLSKAGYRTEYIGKFLNGYNSALYMNQPKGWDIADILVDPWTYQYNTPVFSQNGRIPILYRGYHQTDVIRAKTMSRLEYLTDKQDKPFYLTIAPVSPHVEIRGLPVPLARHAKGFPNATAPQGRNFNPSDALTAQKPSWLKDLPLMKDTDISRANDHFRHRIRALQGVDEIVQDVVDFLDRKKLLNNTYIIYSSDNGYHLGQHRVNAGKTLPYIEDSNLPFIVRGPNVPAGKSSRLPGTHIDLAPTFLDIACLEKKQYPVYLDGRSLLNNWHYPTQPTDDSNTCDIINIEFWGKGEIEARGKNGSDKNSYKTLRVVSEKNSWLYSKWCTGDRELYNTQARYQLSLAKRVAANR